MLILVSGEGPTDMGQCSGESPTGEAAFTPGPMAWLVDQIAEVSEGYPFLSAGLMCCVSEHALSLRSKALRPTSLPGRKRGKETAYYFHNARALALTAWELAATELLTDLPFHHRDPFDRLLIAQSMAEGIPLISCDEHFDAYGISLIW